KLIERKSRRGHQSESRNDRSRDCVSRYKGRTETPQKDEDDDCREQSAFDQMSLDGFERSFDEDGLIANDLGLETGREKFHGLRQLFFDGICNRNSVLA